LKTAIPYYILGKHVEMPPQPRFNTGERLNAVTIIIGTGLFGVTGLLMWFGRGYIPAPLFQIAVIVHDLTAVCTFAMFIVHFFLAVVHPLMWQSLVSMRYGVVSESYAREHHAMWYYGEERARELWEARNKNKGDEH
ncbi:MAG TPA: cytochrome b/b6 domain-containing protein, partial [Anaerolineae bacterium]|nr:cytochrome b/b6 domain-containing protein [Anaerolineae bacterium]